MFAFLNFFAVERVTVATLSRGGAMTADVVGLKRPRQPTSTATNPTAATRATMNAMDCCSVSVLADGDGTVPNEIKHEGLMVLFKATA